MLEALNSSRFAIRQMITAKVKLKYSPEIRFIYDHGFENAIKVDKVSRGLSDEDKNNSSSI